MIRTAVRPHAKSIFRSKTFWGAVATFWIAILPDLQAIAADLKLERLDRLLRIAAALTATGITIYGRYSANTEIYTPDWMPGRNEPKEPPLEESPHDEPT